MQMKYTQEQPMLNRKNPQYQGPITQKNQKQATKELK
jgi:hypothetical protein